jgi:hypothetical protein
MADNVLDGEKPRLTLGQAIDQVISALKAFDLTEQQTILRAVYAHLNISGPKTENTEPRSELEPRVEQAAVRPEHVSTDIKTFKEMKNPSSARQMACVVAYYLAEIASGDERKKAITTADIEKYFKQARFPLPNKLEQLLLTARDQATSTPRRGANTSSPASVTTSSRTSFRQRVRVNERRA